ncbi:MAG: FGGY-family carbohydrate kinase [bacterium]
MAGSVLIGIDLGTTVLKVCAFDAKTGALLAQAARRLPVRAYPEGGREQRTGALDRAFRESVAEVQGLLGNRWKQTAGIGLAAQGGSTIIAGRATGKPLTSMILWNDGRSLRYAQRLAESAPAGLWRKTVLRDYPPSGLGRFLWLKETRPELFRDDSIHIGAGEYLYFQLTGVWRQDAGNAIQTGSYHAGKKRLDATLLDRVGVPLSFVAPLRRGHETSPLSRAGAKRLGLPEGIPVAGPYIDQEAGYLSAAGGLERPLQCSLGTAWVGNFVLPDDTTGFSPIQLPLPSPVGEGRLVVQPLLTGNPSWDWGLDQFIQPDRAAALAEAEGIFKKQIWPPAGLVCLPWFTQIDPFNGQTYGGGVFTGMNDRTGRDDLLRAVAAGMACELARMFRAARDTGDIGAVALGGGASKGFYFRRMIAGLFAPLPVFWQVDQDLAAARGSVYAFHPAAARSRLQRVSPPDGKTLAEILRGSEVYETIFERLYHASPIGAAFSHQERKK